MDNAQKEALVDLARTMIARDPRVKARLARGEEFRRQMTQFIRDEFRHPDTSAGMIIYALMFNVALTALTNEAGNRGSARDKIESLIDQAFEAAQVTINGNERAQGILNQMRGDGTTAEVASVVDFVLASELLNKKASEGG